MILNFLEEHRRIIVAGLLLLMFSLGIMTMIGDSAIVDEIAHIPAGYSYVAFHDYRLNPEHPPLLKDLAALPLLFLNLKFPSDIPAWTTDVNGQWEAGWNFLYHYGNNADLILFFSRLPILLLAVLFGLIIYAFCRRFFGTPTALAALFFYSLSPNFLAHDHLVTTDLGIAFFTFLALCTFALFIKEPNAKTLSYATLAFTAAQLAKFSAVLLIPFYFGILLIMAVASERLPKLNFFFGKKIKNRLFKRIYLWGGAYIVLGVCSLLLIWGFYALHTFNFPADKQIELIKISLPDDRIKIVKDILVGMTGIKFFQPLAQYILGVTMVFGRVSGGNTTFFLGEVNNQSFKWYFPVSYLLKTPLPLLLLVVLSIITSLIQVFSMRIRNWWRVFKKFVESHVEKLIFLLFIIFYAGVSIVGNLNLGIRHLFPILPLIYVLVAGVSIKFFQSFQSNLPKKIAASILGLLLFWYGITAFIVFPHYISYFNEIIGGGKNAYLYFTDSNVDWGQDLKRLGAWLKDNPQVEKLKLDYFGGGEPKYYFCSRKYDSSGQLVRTSSGYDCTNSVYQEWHSKYGPTKGWIAVSVTFLQNARWYAKLYGEPDYDWLREQMPYAKIGNSIFVYWVR